GVRRSRRWNCCAAWRFSSPMAVTGQAGNPVRSSPPPAPLRPQRVNEGAHWRRLAVDPDRSHGGVRPLPAPGEPEGLILFDGVCVFCSRWVRWVIERDHEARYRFMAVQTPGGRALALRLGI